MARINVKLKENKGGKPRFKSAYSSSSGEATKLYPNIVQHQQLQRPHKVNAGISKKVNSPGAEDKPGGKEVN